MITIEGQDFYNYAEALLYLMELYKDIYTKEELDAIIGRILTAEEVEELINTATAGINADILAIRSQQNEFNNALNFLYQRLTEIERELITAAQVRQIVQEELGVIENGTY